MLLRFGAKATLIISSPDMAREIFKEHDLVFSQRPRTVFLDIFNIAQKGIVFIIYFQIFELCCLYENPMISNHSSRFKIQVTNFLLSSQ